MDCSSSAPPAKGRASATSYPLRKELIERTCRQVRHRVPAPVGITDTAFVESANVARWAADAGADALVVAPPYYLPEGQPELQEYLDHLVPELPLPLTAWQGGGWWLFSWGFLRG